MLSTTCGGALPRNVSSLNCRWELAMFLASCSRSFSRRFSLRLALRLGHLERQVELRRGAHGHRQARRPARGGRGARLELELHVGQFPDGLRAPLGRFERLAARVRHAAQRLPGIELASARNVRAMVTSSCTTPISRSAW